MRRLLLWLLGAKVLRLRPGDVVVVKTRHDEKAARLMADEIKRVLPLGVRALIVPRGTTVGRNVSDRSPPA